jgi:hypothetical protein
MKSAVELFAQWSIQRGIGYNINDLEEAKEMEKEQMIEFACQVAEASAMKYIQGKTTRMIAEELIKQQL